MAQPKPRQTSGRYRRHYGAVGPSAGNLPPTGLARPPASVNLRTAIAAVPDPWSPAGPAILATVNRQVDVLEDERSHGRISEAAYREGRIAQAVFERARGPGSCNWSFASRVDAFTAKELSIIYGIDSAARIQRLVDWLRQQLGRIDANILQRVLGEQKSFSEVATLQGKSGARGAWYVAHRFRDALEALASARAARRRVTS
jgi:hypothetical protein